MSGDFESEGKENMRGAFILFEGVDRCGKTTQAQRLVESLRAQGPVEFMRFPDRTTGIGQMINSYLQSDTDLDDKAVHLLFAANRWEAKSRLESLLQAGTTVVVDRYSYSGVAFSAAKEGMQVDWCMQPEVGLPAPDGVIYLDLTVEQAMTRGAFGEERYEKEDMQRKVRDNFFALMQGTGAGAGADTAWHVLDASKSMDEVTADVQEVAACIIKAAQQRPIGTLSWSAATGTGAVSGGGGST